MRATKHKGWLIESQSYESDGNRWCPRALVSDFDGGRAYTHTLLALLSVTFDAARDADDYAVKMAKTWIEDRDSGGRAVLPSRGGMPPYDQERAPSLPARSLSIVASRRGSGDESGSPRGD